MELSVTGEHLFTLIWMCTLQFVAIPHLALPVNAVHQYMAGFLAKSPWWETCQKDTSLDPHTDATVRLDIMHLV